MHFLDSVSLFSLYNAPANRYNRTNRITEGACSTMSEAKTRAERIALKVRRKQRLVRVALGEEKADVVLKNADYVNVPARLSTAILPLPTGWSSAWLTITTA